ncbi:unnamed protein product [Macrosiphum euphorbiae]|uniref:ATP synthase subunit f, mitochondrial n=2 Tax=Macrosiphum euphorbiae TaxID=13131 RepID=A0AAV0WMP6_9HEMI|nr:unnamed protein product [Macrosiphum euphorbiae]
MNYIQMIVSFAKTNMQKIQDHPVAAQVFKRIGDHPAAGVFKGIGDYPAEYNPKVHGPYDPARFYGTPSTPFSELKLYEVPQWLKCRNKSPKSFAALFSRAYWRWSHQYVQPKRTTVAPLIQGLTGMMLIFYIINYGKTIRHRNYKYH